MGHLSQEWESLQGDVKHNKIIQKADAWAANIVTTILQQTIDLWELRNADVHGKTTSEQTSKLLQRQKHIIANALQEIITSFPEMLNLCYKKSLPQNWPIG